MTWTNRVVWLEGMFLRARHFRQQERWLEALVRDRTASLRPHGWGLTEAAINRNLLAAGQFALASGSGGVEARPAPPGGARGRLGARPPPPPAGRARPAGAVRPARDDAQRHRLSRAADAS